MTALGTLNVVWKELEKLAPETFRTAPQGRTAEGEYVPVKIGLTYCNCTPMIYPGDVRLAAELTGPLLMWMAARWPRRGLRFGMGESAPWHATIFASGELFPRGYAVAEANTPTEALATLSLKVLQGERVARP